MTTGPRVLVTRSQDGGEFSQMLAQAGMTPVEVPLLQVTYHLDGLLALEADPDVIVVPSGHGADVLAAAWPRRGRELPHHAVGSTTQARLVRGVRTVAGTFDTAHQLVAGWAVPAGQRVLLVRSDVAGDALAVALRQRGAVVTDVVAYTNRLPDGVDSTLRRQLPVAATALLSASAARRLAAILPASSHAQLGLIAAIGPSTAAAAREAGLPLALVAHPPRALPLVRALAMALDVQPTMDP